MLADAERHFSMTPRMSSSRRMRCSSPSIFTSVPEYLPKRTRSPAFTSSLRTVPSSRTLPLPTAMTSPSIGFSLAVSGMMMPALGLLFFLDALDDDAVLQRSNRHVGRSLFQLVGPGVAVRSAAPPRAAAARRSRGAPKPWDSLRFAIVSTHLSDC